jgi:hypothetical protein
VDFYSTGSARTGDFVGTFDALANKSPALQQISSDADDATRILGGLAPGGPLGGLAFADAVDKSGVALTVVYRADDPPPTVDKKGVVTPAGGDLVLDPTVWTGDGLPASVDNPANMYDVMDQGALPDAPTFDEWSSGTTLKGWKLVSGDSMTLQGGDFQWYGWAYPDITTSGACYWEPRTPPTSWRTTPPANWTALPPAGRYPFQVSPSRVLGGSTCSGRSEPPRDTRRRSPVAGCWGSNTSTGYVRGAFVINWDEGRTTVTTEHEAPGGPPQPRQKFLAELYDAITVRTLFLVLGVLGIQMGFVLSYVGAFHHPTPHRVPVAVAAPAPVSGGLVGEINGINGEPLRATAVPSEAAGRLLLSQGSTSGVLVVNAQGTTDTLLVAGGGGAAIATAVEDVVTRFDAAAHRNVDVVDAVPAQPGDARGLSGFYLVVGWLVGGYLAAALLGVSAGARPANTRRAVIRLLSMVPYAILSGLGGALIIGPWVGALTGNVLALWWVGALLVLSAAAVTMAFQVLFGVIGVGVTVVLFVVLGNPSAGGAYPAPLLPTFWRVISSAIPNGAGVQAVRKIVYFGGHAIAGNLVVVAIWAVAGAAVAVAGAAYHSRRAPGEPITAALTA